MYTYLHYTTSTLQPFPFVLTIAANFNTVLALSKMPIILQRLSLQRYNLMLLPIPPLKSAYHSSLNLTSKMVTQIKFPQ